MPTNESPGAQLRRMPRYAVPMLLLCAAVFVLRGPVRAADGSVNLDAPLLLAAAATWRAGGNPYDTASVAAVIGDRVEGIAETLQRGRQAFVYSPAAYALIAPLTYLPPAAQRWSWNLLNTAMFVAALALTCRLARVRIRSRPGAAIIGLGLVTNPGQICIALGQTGIAAFFLMTLSWWLAPCGAPSRVPRPWLAALAAAAAAIIKPQIAVVLLCYDLFTARRPVALGAAAIAAAAMAVALTVHGDAATILQSWVGNMRALMGADADPLHGPLPHQLINLQSPLAVLTGSRSWSTLLAVGACTGLGALYGALAWRGRRALPAEAAEGLSALAATTLLMLLVFYHRIYDAVFLMIPAALAVRRIYTGDRRGWLLLAALAPLGVPLSSIVYRALDSAGSFSTGALAQAFLVQHQTWFLVAGFALLCHDRGRALSASRRSHGADATAA